MSVLALCLFPLSAAAGAAGRYVLDQMIQGGHERVFPWGTWVVNVSGAFALGLLVATEDAYRLSPDLVTVAGAGFLGAYTTFSTFTWETMRQIEDGALGAAALNVGTTLTAGLAAATVGYALGSLI
ncbi:MAG: hypothetical protein GEU93_03290 [Propionibacteriales bacterium]|nr:hypothetical protein [Propionibacteriales bacterium]